MLKKNIEKEERKQKRKMWTGFYPRKTPTKKEKQDRMNKKYVNKYVVDRYLLDKY